MANAPAGWYEDPSAPGVARYWDGIAWLAPGVGPAAPAPAPSFEPQGTAFAPAAPPDTRADFAVAAMPQQARAEFLPAALPPEPIPSFQTAPVAESVPWDVVGQPRAAETPSMPGFSAPAPSAPPWAPAPYIAAPAAPYSSRRRSSGLSKAALVVVAVTVAFGVRWALGLFSGGDYSDDGDISTAVPSHWSTLTTTAPDLTYAMDPSWVDARGALGLDSLDPMTKIIDARSITSSDTAEAALFIFDADTAPLGQSRLESDFMASAVNATLDGIAAKGITINRREEVIVLRSQAGDRWAISGTTLTVDGTQYASYLAVSVIDGYIVKLHLVVPLGGALTQRDLLAVANSVEAR